MTTTCTCAVPKPCRLRDCVHYSDFGIKCHNCGLPIPPRASDCKDCRSSSSGTCNFHLNNLKESLDGVRREALKTELFDKHPQSEWEESDLDLGTLCCDSDFCDADCQEQTEKKIKGYITRLLHSRDEKLLMDVAHAFGNYWPIGGRDLDDLPKLAKEMDAGIRESEKEKLREKLKEVIEKWSGDGQSFTKGVLQDLDDILKALN